MYSFGQRSQERLATCHKDLQDIMNTAIKLIDFTVLWGHRGEQDQNKAFNAGRSKTTWPNSKHNQKPSMAIDIAPWPIDWHNKYRFYYMAGIVMGIAKEKGIDLRYGGDWDRDGELVDNSFDDLGHFELVKRG